MDHHLGRIDLVSWQSPRSRKMKLSVSPWMMTLSAAALVGLLLLVAQLVGWLNLDGPFAVIPAMLVLTLVGAKLIQGVRATLAWLGG